MLPSSSPLALEDLGWASFQDLAMAYAEDLFSGPVTTYAKSWDGGVDGNTAWSCLETPCPGAPGRSRPSTRVAPPL